MTYEVDIISKNRKGGISNAIRRFACCILSEDRSHHKDSQDRETYGETYGISDLHYKGESSYSKEYQWMLRQTYGHDVDEHFVGMESDIKQLVSLMVDKERDHRVISIWGMGGLGKTSLARKIFNHETIRASFESFAWVCITQQCKLKEVVQDMLKQILGEEEKIEKESLVIKLHQVLKEKKCLIVLDDIWKIEDWEILSHAFPVQTGGSKILLTTREQNVAKKGFMYELKFLTEEEGLELLRKIVFAKPKKQQEQQEMQEIFEDVGREIVQNCGYLPLAITAIGGILREKSCLEEWRLVSKNIESNLKSGSSVLNVLNLSYYELPYYLKPCFLYFGRYKKDKILRWNDLEKLYHLWISEEFVLEKHRGKSESMVDVAQRYLTMLASRCMVQVEVDVDHMITIDTYKSCRVHNLMRDVCLSKAGDENLFKVVNLNRLNNYPSSLKDHERRLSITIEDGFDNEVLSEQISNQHLRSLFLSTGEDLNQYKVDVFKELKLVRVLELSGCKVKLPRKCNKLMHLRYLGFKGCILKGRLSNISELPFLQTLNLENTNFEGTYSLSILSNMIRLKHVFLGNVQFNSFPDHLETLHGYQVSRNRPTDLSNLVNIRSFEGTVEINDVSALIDQINCWSKPKWVQLGINVYIPGEYSDIWKKVFLCEKLTSLRITGCMLKFPSYDSRFCLNLTRCWLVCTRFDEDPMQFLKKLPELRLLELCSYSFMGKELVCDNRSFPQLKALVIFNLPNLEIWRVEEGAMPNLYELTIRNCEFLETITDELSFSTIKKFDIENVSGGTEQKYKKLHAEARNNFHQVEE